MTCQKLNRIGAVIVFMIGVHLEPAIAQRPYQQLADDLLKQARFQQLPAQVLELVDGAINAYDQGDNPKSLQCLKKIIAVEETGRATGLFRAWVYQWQALNYFAMDSSEIARFYVRRSLDEDIDIWPENFDADRFSGQFLGLYHLCYTEIFDVFNKKRKSWRVAPLGTITRADYSYRFGIVDVVAGLGATAVVVEKNKLKVKYDNDLLLYLRLQRMRKNFKKLTAGFYGEFSLLLKESKKPAKIVSFGPILSYTYRPGWELGFTFETARLIIASKDADNTKINLSQTAFNEKGTLALSYGNFEFYIRKWF